jgi:uncharacterized membrane protein (DUF4010 family)
MGPVEGINRLRARLPGLLSVWAAATVAEVLLYYLFLSRPYFREVFLPFAVAVLVAAGIATWRLLRGRRERDRRSHERRLARRREARRGAGE